MFKQSDIPNNTKINNTNTRVQTAKADTSLRPLGRANIGTTYKGALIFEDSELEMNLISIPRLDDDGCKIEIEDGTMIVKKNEKIIMSGRKEDGLYQFDLDGTETALLGNVKTNSRSTTLQRIHNRLGHRNLLRIAKYVKEKKLKIEGFPANVTDREVQSLPLCDACTRAKFTRRKLKRIEKTRMPGVGGKLSTDMKGPIRVTGMKGERYYQGFLDENSKYLAHRCFAAKSDAPRNLEEILCEPPFHENLKNYHSDGAPELISKEIVGILRPKGVQITYSAPYKSSDNPTVERSHRTVFESAHAMLIHACLSITFWCYAVAHSVWLYNRIPTNTAAGYIAPVTAAFGTDVDLSNEHSFGCTCYAIIPESTREKGFTDKSYKAIYLGHRPNNSPGYIVHFIEINQVKEVSDVTFDESDLDTSDRSNNQAPTTGLEFSPISRNINDFLWLIGFAYRDEGVFYITTRVVVQHGMIVAYRKTVTPDGKTGVEETRPIHVADVESLVRDYLAENEPSVDLGGLTGVVVINGGCGEPKEEEKSAGPEEGNTPSEETKSLSNGEVADGRLKGDDLASNASKTGRSSSPQKRYNQHLSAKQPQTGTAREGYTHSATREPIDQKQSGSTPLSSASNVGAQEAEATTRVRATRVPLNVGVLGDVEKTFFIKDNNIEYIYNVSDVHVTSPNVLLYNDVVGCADTPAWMEAARDEVNSIVLDNNTWEPAELPAGVTPLTTKWIFKKKKKEGKVRYKARLCVRGFKQRYGIDYTETYAPTAKWVTLRLFLTICACLGLFTRQLDVKTAFLYAELDEDIYIVTPEGICDKTNPFNLSKEARRLSSGRILRLKKSLYGLKQAPRNWFQTLKQFLLDTGFTSLLTEACIFFKYVDGRIVIIIIFVDDILIGAKSSVDLEELVRLFEERFKISDSGEVNVYLSINITRNLANYSMELDQTEYILQMWNTFKGVENKRITTPFQDNWRIDIEEELENQNDADRAFVAEFPYRELVGSLLFIQICTRGDIAYEVHYLSRFNNRPCKALCLAAKRVLIYLFNTRDRKLTLGGTKLPLLTLFCDTDFAACVDTRKTVECFMVFFGIGCIMWQVKQQSRVAQSTGEAEFCAVTPGVNMIVWIRQLLKELKLGYQRATAVYTDNDVARAMIENPVHYSRMKQISTKYFMLRQVREVNVICAGRIPTDLNPADLGTKPLSYREHCKKARTFFDGLSTLDFDRIPRPLTVANDEYA